MKKGKESEEAVTAPLVPPVGSAHSRLAIARTKGKPRRPPYARTHGRSPYYALSFLWGQRGLAPLWLFEDMSPSPDVSSPCGVALPHIVGTVVVPTEEDAPLLDNPHTRN